MKAILITLLLTIPFLFGSTFSQKISSGNKPSSDTTYYLQIKIKREDYTASLDTLFRVLNVLGKSLSVDEANNLSAVAQKQIFRINSRIEKIDTVIKK